MERETEKDSDVSCMYDATIYTCAGFSVLMLILFIVLGSVSLAFQKEQSKWYESDCFIQGVNFTTLQSCQSTIYYGVICNPIYQVQWNVTYYNDVAGLVLNSSILQNYTSISNLNVDTLIKRPGTEFQCFYNSDDFGISWTLVDDNYVPIGISALVFGGLLVSSVITIITATYLKVKRVRVVD
jgi:hypothetical protein